MPKRVLILGGGTGGLIISRELREQLNADEAEITVVDKKKFSEFRPSYLYIATGYRKPDQIRAPLDRLAKWNINYINAEVKAIDPANRSVKTTAGEMKYDVLVVALGAETVPVGAPHPWELDDALKAADAISGFKGGSIVVATHSMPYRCPPAPIEFAMLLHFYFLARGMRDKVKITMVHPMKRPFENFGPVAAKAMTQMLAENGIEYIGLGQQKAVNSFGNGVLETTAGEKVKYDLLFVVPPHKAPDPVANSDLAKNGWAAPRNPPSGDFRSAKFDDVYVVGDVAAPNVPVGMAGTILHSYAPWVVSNIVADVNGVSLGKPPFRIVGVCALDTGAFGMAAACDFTKFVKKEKPYPDCWFLPPSSPSRLFKELFEKMYFNWLLQWTP